MQFLSAIFKQLRHLISFIINMLLTDLAVFYYSSPQCADYVGE